MVGTRMNNSANDKQIVGADEGEEFVVERIVSHRFRNGRKEYLLAWKGYPEEENTWVKNFNLFLLKRKLIFTIVNYSRNQSRI